MLLAHIFGIPVEETALTFAPAIVTFIVGARAYGRRMRRKPRLAARPGGAAKTSSRRVDPRHPDSSGSAP
jgi:hypothetical protein